MAKRFQPFKEFGRTTKKPRLDISISKAARPATTYAPVPVQERAAPSGNGAVTPSPNNNNFWDDDDDDVILLATQMAETQAGIKTESELTFSEFAPHVHATTSTQMPPAPARAEENDIVSLLFDDDDEFDQLLAAAVAKKVPEPKSVPKNTFKMPPTPVSATVSAPARTDQLSQPLLCSQSQSTTAARRQQASERQLEFLMKRMDELKKENSKLSNDLGEAKSKIESKDGETTLLRDEVRHMKQQLQALKMEKIVSTEAAKSESKTKIAELSKRVAAKETELQLKNVEYSVLKMKHADESQRFEMSMRNVTLMDTTDAVPENKNNNSLTTIRAMLRMRNLPLKQKSAAKVAAHSETLEMSELIYEHSRERGSSKKQRTVFQLELENMQTLLAQLQLKLKQHISLNESELSTFTQRVLASIRKVFPELWSYVHSLEFPKHCHVHPYHDYSLFGDLSVQKPTTLHQPQEMYVEERALNLRRYIAALAVICRQLPELSSVLLREKHGEYLLLQIAIDAICQLGFSRELCEHFGLLEAFAALLRSLLRNLHTNAGCDDAQIQLIVGLLKQLTFARPSPRIFRELSYCILECTRLPQVMSLLCVNSDEKSFNTDRVRSLYRFTNDSCILQVYAGLLEIAFPLNVTLSVEFFKLLTVICANHVRFAYYCFVNPPNFIHQLLPSYDDDDDDGAIETESENHSKIDENMQVDTHKNDVAIAVHASGSNSTTSSFTGIAAPKQASGSIKCECYTKLCLSVVTLLYQVLREWVHSEQSLETSRVIEISKISVQLLHIIFCDNYLTRLFRDAEETTKHYLALICKWWAENAEALHFNHIQMNFLKKLQNSHVIPCQIKEEGNIANVGNDLSEWYNLTADASSEAQNTGDLTGAIKNLRLLEDAGDADKFFEVLKGYAFNFE